MAGRSAALGRWIAHLVAEEDSGVEVDDAFQVTLTGRFLRAILTFDHALATGEAIHHDQAVRMLARATEMCLHRNFVTLWWICFIARHLIEDLWSHSLHVRLPRGGDMPDGERFEELRNLSWRCFAGGKSLK